MLASTTLPNAQLHSVNFVSGFLPIKPVVKLIQKSRPGGLQEIFFKSCSEKNLAEAFLRLYDEQYYVNKWLYLLSVRTFSNILIT